MRLRRFGVALTAAMLGGGFAVSAALTPSAASEGHAARPSAEGPTAEDFEAYFFPHFKGESTPDGEQIYFALSRGNNALDWQSLNDDEPVLQSTMGEQGLRDPFIIRSHEGDKFYMLATDLKTYREGQGPDFARAQQTGSRSLMIWESTDLVNWSDQRMVEVSSPYAGNTWAPEAHYVDELGAYVVYWASNLYPTATDTHLRRTRDSYNRMMYSVTKDFVTFTEPKVWIDIRRGPGRGMIDSTVVEHDGMFYRFTKDERNDIMEVLLEKSPDLLRREQGAVGTSWNLITERIGSGDPLRHAEGPTAFKANPGDVNVVDGQDTWYLFQDWPPYGGGHGYVAFSSTDLDDPDGWTHQPGLNLSARHGTVLPITQLEHTRLRTTDAQQCNETLTGRIDGPIEVTEGVTCLDDATVAGGVTVRDGASLVADGGHIAGSLNASRAHIVSLNGAEVSGPTSLTGTTGWEKVTGSVLRGPVEVTDSAGTVAPDLSNTSVRGALSCWGNASVPVLAGTEVTGPTFGQCAR